MPIPTLDATAARTPVFRRPQQADAVQVRALIDECRPLDVNSLYAYLLLCTHFSETSAIAEADGHPLGFVGGYLKPSDPSVLFIWQVAVSPRARGLGVGGQLLQEPLNRPACRHVRFMEATITPSNEASWVLFRSFARTRQAACQEIAMFGQEDFAGANHEDERLLRIGPFGGLGDGR